MTAIPPAAVEFAALQDAILGEVVAPGRPRYETVRRPVAGRLRDARPLAVVLCATPADVAATLAFARRAGVPTATRSGGHCFAGRSSTPGIVIDVSPMGSVSVADGLATVGAGARLGDVYDALAEHGLTIAAGCGPTVGIAGLTLGGGLGILGRTHGLTCDQLVAAQAVLADGRVVECDERRDADLFWALRGAGGGQFAVLTRLVLRTLAAPAATTFHLTWPRPLAPAAIAAWQDWSPDAPDELAASLLLTAVGDAPVTAHVFGAMLGTEAETTALLEAMIGRVGARPDASRLERLPYRAAKRHLAEHGPGEPADPSEPPDGWSKSEFFRRPLPDGAIAELVAHLARDRPRGQSRVLDFSPWGGAYNRVGPGATAFPHRRERFVLKHDVATPAGAASHETLAAREWLARSWALAHPWGSGGVYPNFPDPDLEDPERAYHGANLERLRRVKARYDPEAAFDFPQAVRPA